MLEPCVDSQNEQNENIDRYKLLELLDGIKPSNLSKISQTNYVKKLVDRIQQLIIEDGSNLILIVQAIKGCKKPCYKRDVVLEILKSLVLSVRTLSLLLSKPFKSTARLTSWKELANSLVAVPDVVANCGVLSKYPELKNDAFYSQLLTVLYAVLLEATTKAQDLSLAIIYPPEQRLFYGRVIGRIAISHCQLVWAKFTSRAMKETRNDATGIRLLLTEMIESPSSSVSQSMNELGTTMGIFSEPLIAPILYNFTPLDIDSCGGELIKSILGTSILYNEVLEYTLCNKYLLQTNYKHNKYRQLMILFNIFSYLSSLNCIEQNEKNLSNFADSSSSQSKEQPMNQKKLHPQNLLIKTLLAVSDSWSDSTKILLRPYEQSRFITCAFIIGMRFALHNDKPSLAGCAHKLQANIIQGFPVYLNRASEKHRHLAMCLGEVVLVKLHNLMDEHQVPRTGDDENHAREPKLEPNSDQRVELNFNVKWDSESLFIKNLLDCDIVSLFDKTEEIEATTDDSHHQDDPERNSKYQLAESLSANSMNDDELIACVSSQLKQSSCNSTDEEAHRLKMRHDNKPAPAMDPFFTGTKSHSSKKAVIELDNEGLDGEEDLVPYELSDEDEEGRSTVDDYDEQDESAPIYLRDCIAGLAENKHPRYVRLCLIRLATILEDKNNEPLTIALSLPEGKSTERRVVTGTAISDVAVELAQLLLYLDDQYGISEFEAYRMRALSDLCVASPDIAVKYLLDEFNGTTRSIRHQLDILQALVISAERLAVRGETIANTTTPVTTSNTTSTNNTTRTRTSTSSTNGFVKYVSLYFYGIVHRLKADLNVAILPSTIVSATVAAAGIQSNANSRQETMIRRVIDSLTSSMSQIDRNLLFSSSRSFARNPTTASATTFTTTTANTTPNTIQNSTNTTALSHTTTSLKRANTTTVEQVSLLIKCVYQQPVTCKLANDLLDILAAYRGHPDVGVRKAMVCCLTVVRDCTPSVYFREYLYDKTISLFGEWLSNETTQLTKLLGD